jgi:hypothetical protein
MNLQIWVEVITLLLGIQKIDDKGDLKW